MDGSSFDNCYSFLETFDNKLEFCLNLFNHFKLLSFGVSLNEYFYVQILYTLNDKGIQYNK